MAAAADTVYEARVEGETVLTLCGFRLKLALKNDRKCVLETAAGVEVGMWLGGCVGKTVRVVRAGMRLQVWVDKVCVLQGEMRWRMRDEAPVVVSGPAAAAAPAAVNATSVEVAVPEVVETDLREVIAEAAPVAPTESVEVDATVEEAAVASSDAVGPSGPVAAGADVAVPEVTEADLQEVVAEVVATLSDSVAEAASEVTESVDVNATSEEPSVASEVAEATSAAVASEEPVSVVAEAEPDDKKKDPEAETVEDVAKEE